MGEILAKIGFDWQIALANIINFALVFFLLNKIVFKKIAANLAQRRKNIEQGVQDAQKAKTALLMANEEKNAILQAAHSEAHMIRSEANNYASATIAKLVSEQEKVISDYREKQKDALLQLQKKDLEEFELASVELIRTKLKLFYKDLVADPKNGQAFVSSQLAK